MKEIAVFGASGAIGNALITKLSLLHPNAKIHAFSRNITNNTLKNIKYKNIDYLNEDLLAQAAEEINNLDLVFVATGILHTNNILPEKSLKQISMNSLEQIFVANTISPSLIGKHFIPKLNHKSRAIFAAISARVGSVSDNKLGGWYAYRMSKAALNMFIKTASIEAQRLNKNSIVIGVHPGTVDSKLSKPFQKNIPQGKLFTPEYSAERLIQVLNNLTTRDTGKCFAWDSKEILP
jgi:NAD(P)-dependent dehydrogenase (short-subunit alcohol dehydrogenase family)